jgi:hypothetical protein
VGFEQSDDGIGGIFVRAVLEKRCNKRTRRHVGNADKSPLSLGGFERPLVQNLGEFDGRGAFLVIICDVVGFAWSLGSTAPTWSRKLQRRRCTTPPKIPTVFRFIAVQYYTCEMSKHLESLYQNLLNGKLPHNLSWSEAVDLVEHLGEVQPHGDDEFVFRVGSERVFFKRPHTHDLGVEEVSRLRKFLKEAGAGAHVKEPTQPSRMIVVIDHHAAHVYQDFGGSRPADEHKVQPYDPFNFHHHLIHRKEAHYRGERVPEEDSFYEEIAKDITTANEIVLIGHATGKSNAADFLKEYLKIHHPDISGRVIATEDADLSAVTDPEIEALAKRHTIAVGQQRGS